MIVALALVAVALGPIGQLIATTRHGARLARERTTCGLLAAQKVEQLRSGRWGLDRSGFPVSDSSTDFSSDNAAAQGGGGLSAGPANALDADCPGFVDHVDEWGRWVGAGSPPPGRTVYTRRWRVDPLPADPANTLVIRVIVFARPRGARAADPRGPSVPEGARLLVLRTRYSP